MKIMIICSKHFYNRINEIKNYLEEQGHEITLPNCFDEPFKEERLKLISKKEHLKFKDEMMRLHEPKIREVDAVLILNFEKNGKPNYVGGATFMEIVKAWELNKRIFFYNPIPECIFTDELKGMNPFVINGDLSKLPMIVEKAEVKEKVPKKIGTGFGVMILNKEGKVLLGRRHENPDKADSVFRVSDVWTMPGGKLEYGESFEEGGVREVLEETGMKIKNPKVICVNQDRNEHAHFVTIGLFSEDFEGSPQVMEPDEIVEWQWFNLDNLPKNIYFPSAKVLENYKQKKFYIPLKKLEIEIQSFITKEQYENFLNFFKQNAEFVKEDFQETFYFDENSNLRIQRNNNSAKLWHKSGKVHDEVMEEIEIFVKKEEFENLEKFLNKLGHEVKIKWLRKRNEFDWEGIKVCLDFTKGYGYIIELEKIGSEENKERILEELKMKFNELNIPLTSKEEFTNKYNYYKEHWRELLNGNSS